MFKIFSFKFGNIINLNNIDKINRVMNSFLDNIYISEFTENYRDTFSNTNDKEIEEVNEDEILLSLSNMKICIC